VWVLRCGRIAARARKWVSCRFGGWVRVCRRVARSVRRLPSSAGRRAVFAGRRGVVESGVRYLTAAARRAGWPGGRGAEAPDLRARGSRPVRLSWFQRGCISGGQRSPPPARRLAYARFCTRREVLGARKSSPDRQTPGERPKGGVVSGVWVAPQPHSTCTISQSASTATDSGNHACPRCVIPHIPCGRPRFGIPYR
jgi:hypothetical protein